MREFQLPAQSRQKLADLKLQMMASEDAGRAALARIRMLPEEGVDEIRGRLSIEQGKHQARHTQLHRLVNHLNQFVEELPHVTVLQSVPAVELELNGQTLNETLNDIRTKIAATKSHLQTVRTAPLPKPDQRQAALNYARTLVRNGRPNIAFVDDQLKVSLRGDVFAVEDQLALIAWAAPAELLETLEREIDALPVRADAMPRTERLARVAELEKTLLELEQHEESLICRAASDGLEILRRVDADPRAVLGVVIVKTVAQVA